ncbi:MAG: hypothetical protein M3452_11040, partial [Chloroflexota bacterium]|nr:hypothetical protein [Chloroflexota bacterium]
MSGAGVPLAAGVATGLVGVGLAAGVGARLEDGVGVGLADGADEPAGETLTHPATVNMMGSAASASRAWRMGLLWGRQATG